MSTKGELIVLDSGLLLNKTEIKIGLSKSADLPGIDCTHWYIQ